MIVWNKPAGTQLTDLNPQTHIVHCTNSLIQYKRLTQMNTQDILPGRSYKAPLYISRSHLQQYHRHVTATHTPPHGELHI